MLSPADARALRPTAMLAIAMLLCAACGCAGPSGPTPPSPAAGRQAHGLPRGGLSPLGTVLVNTWNATLQTLPDQPSLLALRWRDVRPGERIDADSVILTGHGAHVGLLIPESAFLPAFLRLVKTRQVVGYAMAGARVRLEVPAGSLFPFRSSPETNPPGAHLKATVTSVLGPAVVSVEHAEIRKHFGALVARTEGAAVSAARPPSHRSLGFSGKDVSQLPVEARRKLSAVKNDGVFVDRIWPDSPASRARLQPGDVILQFGNHPVHDSADLMEAVSQAPTGKPVSMVIYRYTLGAHLAVRILPGGEASPAPRGSPSPGRPAPPP